MLPFSPLRRLRCLDKLSPKFPDRLTNILNGKKFRDYVANLREEDASWLIEYLDNVLGTLQPTSPAFRICLRELRAICGTRKVLPQSHLFSTSSLDVAEQPIASRGPCDAYEGFLNSSKVCVNRLRIYSREGPKDVKRGFCQEAVVWKRLVHPNIVPLLGVTIAPFQSISEWVYGEELIQYVNTHPSADRFALLSGIANGISYLHSHNVIHGDLKGPSIFVDDSGSPHITDFGLSSVASDLGSAVSIADGHAVRWAAPEVLDMERPISRESDVYSFAMVVVEAFTGRVPFYDKTPTTVAVDVLSGTRPDRPTHPNLSDDLWSLTQRCWDHDPQQRPEVSEIVFHLRDGDDTTLDGSTLGSFRRSGLSSGSCCKSSRSAATSHKLQGPWKFEKASTMSNLPQRKGGWFKRCRVSSTRDHCGSPEKPGAVPAGNAVSPTPSQGSPKRCPVQCTGTAMAESFDH